MKPVYFGHRGAVHALAKHDSYESIHAQHENAIRGLMAAGAYTDRRKKILKNMTARAAANRRAAEDRLAAQERIRMLKMQLQHRR